MCVCFQRPAVTGFSCNLGPHLHSLTGLGLTSPPSHAQGHLQVLVYVWDVYGAESSAAAPVSVGASAMSVTSLASRLDALLASSKAAGDVDKTLQVCRNHFRALIRWQSIIVVCFGQLVAVGGQRLAKGCSPAESATCAALRDRLTASLSRASALQVGPLRPAGGHAYHQRHCRY
jgi:hypothetical protein